MDLDLSVRKTLRVKVSEGEVYEMHPPTVDQAESYQKEIKEKGEGNEMRCFISFAESLGLPSKIGSRLDVVQLDSLATELMGMVKKK